MYQVPQFSAKHIKTDVSLQPFASLLPQLGLLHPARCRRISVLDIFLMCSCEGLFYYAVSDGRTRPLKIHRGNYTPHSIYCDRINLCQKIRQATTNSPCGHSLEATIANYHLRNFCKITYSFSHYLILSFQFVLLWSRVRGTRLVEVLLSKGMEFERPQARVAKHSNQGS
jgi:hypothetical protein